MRADAWGDLIAQSIVHGIVAAVVVEALVRAWPARAPGERLALRLVAVVEPLVVSPALVFLWPARADDDFHVNAALFTARAWEDVVLLGVPAFHVWVAALSGAAAALLAMDLRRLLRARSAPAPKEAVPPPALVAAVEGVARAMSLRPPPLQYVDTPEPVLFCAGVRRPGIIVSRGTVALLDPDELEAAIAHELAHVAARDPAASWTLLALRAVAFFNPAVQVVARAMARDAERRADLAAGRARGRVELASALLKLFRASHGTVPPSASRLPFAALVAEPLRRARTHDVEVRCRALLGPEDRPSPAGAARVLLAAVSIALLLAVVA